MISAVFMSRYNFLVPSSSFGLRKIKYCFTDGTKPAQQLPFHHWGFHDLLGNSRAAWGGSNWFHGDTTSLQTPCFLPSCPSFWDRQPCSRSPPQGLEVCWRWQSGKRGYDLPRGQGGGSAGAGGGRAAGERSESRKSQRCWAVLGGAALVAQHGVQEHWCPPFSFRVARIWNCNNTY